MTRPPSRLPEKGVADLATVPVEHASGARAYRNRSISRRNQHARPSRFFLLVGSPVHTRTMSTRKRKAARRSPKTTRRRKRKDHRRHVKPVRYGKRRRRYQPKRHNDLGPWTCICGATGSGGRIAFRRHENTKAHAIKMREDRENNVGFFAPERVRKTLRKAFADGSLISTDDNLREFVGLLPWSEEVSRREQERWDPESILPR